MAIYTFPVPRHHPPPPLYKLTYRKFVNQDYHILYKLILFY